MAHDVPTQEPSELRAGNAWQWDRITSDYPPSEGFALTYYFNGPAAFSLAASTSAQGDYYEIRGTPSANASRAAGTYRLVGLVASATETFTLYDGFVVVLPNIATQSATQTFAEQQVAALETLILARSSSDQAEIEINGRRVKKEELPALRRELGYARAAVIRERNPGKLGLPTEVRFGVLG